MSEHDQAHRPASVDLNDRQPTGDAGLGLLGPGGLSAMAQSAELGSGMPLMRSFGDRVSMALNPQAHATGQALGGGAAQPTSRGGPSRGAGRPRAPRRAPSALRLVPARPTKAFVANRSVGFVVRQTEADRPGDGIAPGDRLISAGRDLPRLESVVVHSPYTPGGRPCALRGGAALVHLMGTAEHTVVARVRLETGAIREVRRTISATRARDEVEQGFGAESRSAAEAPLAALTPVDARVRLAIERANLRRAAMDRGALSDAARASWGAFFTSMVSLLPSLSGSSPHSAWEEAADAADALVAQLGAGRSGLSDIGGRLSSALRGGDGITALAHFDTFTRALDEALADATAAQGDAALSGRLRASAAKDEALSELEDTGGVQPIPARFHPRDMSISAGGIIDVPLEWYVWSDAEQWYLRDITAAGGKSFTYSHPRRAGESAPPRSLFEQVDNSEHFVEGELYYTTPDGREHHLTMTEPMEASDWLALFGTVLLGAGLGMATFGAGAVVAWGNGLLVGSGVAFAGSSAAHMAEQDARGTLTPGGVFLDSLQLLASLATAGTATLTARALRVSAAAGLRQTQGSLLYLSLSRAAVGADLASVVVMGADAWQQIDAIRSGPGSDDDKARALTILLGTLAIQGALAAVSVRNEMGPMDGRAAQLDADGEQLVLRRAEPEVAPPADGVNASRERSVEPELQVGPERSVEPERSVDDIEPASAPEKQAEPPASTPRAEPASPEQEAALGRLREGLNPDALRGMDAFIASEAQRGRPVSNTIRKMQVIYDGGYRAALRQDKSDALARREGRRALRKFLVSRVNTRPDPLWRGRPRIEDGNLDEGWRHIDARHVTGDSPKGPGDLFPPGTTRDELQAVAERVVARGARQEREAIRIQSFTRRVAIRGQSMQVLVSVDSANGRVITMFPMLGGG